MRVLILGGDGMLGHQLWQYFRGRDGYETSVTLRKDLSDYQKYGLFSREHCYTSVDVRNLEVVAQVFSDFRPDVVLNAVGIVKQRPTAKDTIISLEVNSLLPHRLAMLSKAVGARLIHPSTDCVFSGSAGGYLESDVPDATDLYGRSKLMGEVLESHCITLRTSIIGLELEHNHSLIEWFLHAPAEIRGYTGAIYTGVTTLEYCRVVDRLMSDYPNLSGLYHLSSDPITKFSLLQELNVLLGLRRTIIPDLEFACDRSLNSDRFRTSVNYRPPTWHEMLQELANDITKREELR